MPDSPVSDAEDRPDEDHDARESPPDDQPDATPNAPTDAPAEEPADDATASTVDSDEPTETASASEGPADTASEADASTPAGESVPGPDLSAENGASAAADAVPDDGAETSDSAAHQAVPDDVQKYDRFKKIEGGTYDRANEFLRDRTYITAREWAIARLCADFRTETGVEMTKIGENLPELVPFMTDTYTPQAVNQARAAFEEKVRKAGATFLYGAMCDFFTAEELDDVMYEATEVAKFLLEVEGVELSVEEELEAEDRISEVMRDVREHSAALRHDECPHCGGDLDGGESDGGNSTAEADD